MKTSTQKNIRKQSVAAGVPVSGSESMKRRANGNILVNRYRLAVGSKHWCIVVVIGYSNFYVCRVDVTWVGVLYVDGHVKEWMQQRIKVDWLQQIQ